MVFGGAVGLLAFRAKCFVGFHMTINLAPPYGVQCSLKPIILQGIRERPFQPPYQEWNTTRLYQQTPQRPGIYSALQAPTATSKHNGQELISKPSDSDTTTATAASKHNAPELFFRNPTWESDSSASTAALVASSAATTPSNFPQGRSPPTAKPTTTGWNCFFLQVLTALAGMALASTGGK